MKRLHVHVHVHDLPQSIGYYSGLFARRPTVQKPDYAKWMLEDPRVNFAISARTGGHAGIDHLGIQTDDAGELAEMHTRLAEAGRATFDEPSANCCYARSAKHWDTDPNGVVWEIFHTLESTIDFGEDGGVTAGRIAEREIPPSDGPAGHRRSCCP